MYMPHYKSATLDKFKKKAFKQINDQYKTMEEFSFVNDISKSLLSNFFSDRQNDFQYSTVERIAKALHIKIVFQQEKKKLKKLYLNYSFFREIFYKYMKYALLICSILFACYILLLFL